MTVKTGAGTKAYISTTATAAATKSALAALSYTEVKFVEGLGEIGPQNTDTTFTPLDGSAVQHLKGSTDYGATAVGVGRDPLDPGQIAMRAAVATYFEYGVKIVLKDAPTEDHTDSIIYVRGPVMSGRLTIGGADPVVMEAFSVGNNAYFLEPAAEIP